VVRETYRDPIFNLKAVVEATGVSADALRAWERRYGLPQPARTAADHRIYSRRDIDIIKWLVARQEEGLRIGRAVDLWRSLEEQGQDPLRRMPPPSEPLSMPSGDKTIELREEWLEACLAFDERRAEQTLTRAFSLYPPEVVILDIIQDGIAEMGRRWYAGEATVQQEHFASQLAVRRLKALMSSTPPPTRRGRILVACPPGEEHIIGPLAFALLLRRAGWDVIYLGASVPLDRMEQTVDATTPDVVVLAAQQLHTAGDLLEMAELLNRKDISVAFGGGIFTREPGLRSRVPGHFLGLTLKEAVQQTERLMVKTGPAPTVEGRSDVYEQALSAYLNHQLTLEAEVWQALRGTDLEPEIIRDVSRTFSDSLVTALKFGDIELLDDYVDWMERRNGNDRLSARTLHQVLEAYLRVMKDQLDEYGALIADWLDQWIRRRAEGSTQPE